MRQIVNRCLQAFKLGVPWLNGDYYPLFIHKMSNKKISFATADFLIFSIH